MVEFIKPIINFICICSFIVAFLCFLALPWYEELVYVIGLPIILWIAFKLEKYLEPTPKGKYI